MKETSSIPRVPVDSGPARFEASSMATQIAAVFEAIAGTPAGSLLTLLSLLANLAKSISTLGLDAMLADAFTLCLSLITTALWTRPLYLKLRQPVSRIVDLSGRPTRVNRRGEVALMAVLAVLPVALALWTCRPLLARGFDNEWIFCGSVVTHCPNACVRLLDSQEREISDCLLAEDDTGYVEVRRTHWYVYRPHFLSVSCPGSATKPIAVPAAMMSPSCGGHMEIP
jgi:hypothetical protein